MTKKTQTPMSRELYTQYDSFVRQIDIIDLYIVSARIDNIAHLDLPTDIRINVREKAWYENQEDQVIVYIRYSLTAKDNEKQETAARISVTLAVVYDSAIPLTDEIFQIFKERNLPVNTWPYFREFAHSASRRMGWAGMVTPVRKVDVSR